MEYQITVCIFTKLLIYLILVIILSLRDKMLELGTKEGAKALWGNPSLKKNARK